MHLKIEKALQAVAPVELLHLKIGTQEFHLQTVATMDGPLKIGTQKFPSASCCLWVHLKIGAKIFHLLVGGAAQDWHLKYHVQGAAAEFMFFTFPVLGCVQKLKKEISSVCDKP